MLVAVDTQTIFEFINEEASITLLLDSINNFFTIKPLRKKKKT